MRIEMKGSDSVKMSININGEIIQLDVKFDDQNNVRDAEREVKSFLDKWRKNWSDASDRKLLAMAAFQFAKWFIQLRSIQDEALEITNTKCREIENWVSQEKILADIT